MSKKRRKFMYLITFFLWILLALRSPLCSLKRYSCCFCQSFNVLQLQHLISFLHFTYQVKAAVSALWNTRGLSWPTAFEQKAGDLDLLDWLKAMFGFQACIWLLERQRTIDISAFSFFPINIGGFILESKTLWPSKNAYCVWWATERQCQEPEGASYLAACQCSHKASSQAWTS